MPKNETEYVAHVFVVRTEKRDALQNYLTANNIQTVIHYPVPPHKQACYSEWHNLSLPVTEKIHREALSLPMSPALTEEEVNQIINVVNLWK